MKIEGIEKKTNEGIVNREKMKIEQIENLGKEKDIVMKIVLDNVVK